MQAEGYAAIQLSMNYHTIIQGLKPLLYIEADVSFTRKGKPVGIWRGKKVP